MISFFVRLKIKKAISQVEIHNKNTEDLNLV